MEDSIIDQIVHLDMVLWADGVMQKYTCFSIRLIDSVGKLFQNTSRVGHWIEYYGDEWRMHEWIPHVIAQLESIRDHSFLIQTCKVQVRLRYVLHDHKAAYVMTGNTTQTSPLHDLFQRSLGGYFNEVVFQDRDWVKRLARLHPEMLAADGPRT